MGIRTQRFQQWHNATKSQKFVHTSSVRHKNHRAADAEVNAEHWIDMIKGGFATHLSRDVNINEIFTTCDFCNECEKCNVDGGDSMLSHEIIKFPSSQFVVGLEILLGIVLSA